jgi:hypothetical protein
MEELLVGRDWAIGVLGLDLIPCSSRCSTVMSKNGPSSGVLAPRASWPATSTNGTAISASGYRPNVAILSTNMVSRRPTAIGDLEAGPPHEHPRPLLRSPGP